MWLNWCNGRKPAEHKANVQGAEWGSGDRFLALGTPKSVGAALRPWELAALCRLVFALFSPHNSVNLVSTTCKRKSPWVCDPMEAACSLTSPVPASCKVLVHGSPRSVERPVPAESKGRQLSAGHRPRAFLHLFHVHVPRAKHFPSAPLTT